MRDFEVTMQDVPATVATAFESIEGTVPADLAGTLYRNGPGAFSAGADAFHLLDAHAFVAAVTFDGGRASFRGRTLDTPLRASELKAGKQIQRRIFTNPKGKRHLFDVTLPNLAAHDIYVWGGTPVACDAPGHYVLDPETFAVRGPAPLEAVRPNKQATFCPMPRVDTATGRLVIYTVDPGIVRNDLVEFVEIDKAWNVVHRIKHRLPGKAILLHDLAVTATHYVVPEFAHLDVPAVLWGKKPIYACTGFPAGYKARIFVLPRTPGAPARHVELAPGEQVFHLFNAYDDAGSIVVDAIVYSSAVNFTAFAPPYQREGVGSEGAHPVRFRLDLATGAVTRTDGTVRVDSPDVNPAYHGRPYRFGYAAAKTSVGDEPEPEGYFWYHGCTKIDLETGHDETWDAGPRTFCSPAVFAPRVAATSEDDGYVLAWITDAETRRSALVIVDARAMAAGPVATLWLPHALPPVSHGLFV